MKLRLFEKIHNAEEKLRKLHLKFKFCLQKKYSVFLRKSVLRNNYVIISLECVAYIRR